MSTRRRLLGIEEGEEKVVETTIIVPNFKRTIVDTEDRTFLDNYEFSNIESDSKIIPTQSLPLILGADSFIDPNHVLVRTDLNKLREESPDTAHMIVESIKNLNNHVLTEEEILSEILDVRIALIDQDIRRTCQRLCEDVRAWTGITIPVRYKSSEIRLGIHSVDIKRALDVNGEKTSIGPDYMGRVTLYMYSPNGSELNLIIAGSQ